MFQSFIFITYIVTDYFGLLVPRTLHISLYLDNNHELTTHYIMEDILLLWLLQLGTWPPAQHLKLEKMLWCERNQILKHGNNLSSMASNGIICQQVVSARLYIFIRFVMKLPEIGTNYLRIRTFSANFWWEHHIFTYGRPQSKNSGGVSPSPLFTPLTLSRAIWTQLMRNTILRFWVGDCWLSLESAFIAQTRFI